jgi:hypothetical protein
VAHYSPDVDGKLMATGCEERIWEENDSVLSFDLFVTIFNWRKA